MNANGHGVPDGEEGAWRTCPTRVVPGPPLISHQISPNVCQKRQREYFHKCWTCAFSNRRSQTNGATHVGAASNGTASNGVRSNGAASNGAETGHANGTVNGVAKTVSAASAETSLR